jgi:hypothetical protein
MSLSRDSGTASNAMRLIVVVGLQVETQNGMAIIQPGATQAPIPIIAGMSSVNLCMKQYAGYHSYPFSQMTEY